MKVARRILHKEALLAITRQRQFAIPHHHIASAQRTLNGFCNDTRRVRSALLVARNGVQRSNLGQPLFGREGIVIEGHRELVERDFEQPPVVVHAALAQD